MPYLYSFGNKNLSVKPLKQCLPTVHNNPLARLSLIRDVVLKKLLFHAKNILQNKNWICDQYYQQEMLWKTFERGFVGQTTPSDSNCVHTLRPNWVYKINIWSWYTQAQIMELVYKQTATCLRMQWKNSINTKCCHLGTSMPNFVFDELH